MEPSEQESLLAPYLAQLQEGTDDARREAVRALGRRAVRDEFAARALVEVLRTGEPILRVEAVNAFESIGKSIVGYLVEAIPDADNEMRKAILMTLARMGPAAAAAVPAIEQLRQFESVGEWVERALQAIVGAAQRRRQLLFNRVAIVAAGVALAVALGFEHKIGLNIGKLTPAGTPPTTVVVTKVFALIGGFLGLALGLRSGEFLKAFGWTTSLSLAGAAVGLFLGGRFIGAFGEIEKSIFQ